MYKLVSYRDKFFTNRDDKVRYGRFPSSSSPVSRTKLLKYQWFQEFFHTLKHMIFSPSKEHDFADD